MQSKNGLARELKFNKGCEHCPPSLSWSTTTEQASAYMYTKPLHKDLTLVIEKCGLKTKVKPEELPPDDPKRKTVDMVQFHVLHPEPAQLKLQHKGYVQDGRCSGFKRYPTWEKELAEHNEKCVALFCHRLQKIMKVAGGDCGGGPKPVGCSWRSR